MDPSSKPSGPHKRTRNKKKNRVPPHTDFARTVRLPDPEDAAQLDRLRDDLQESIERVIRVQGAFVKALQKHARHSDRIKHVIQTVGEIPFHCELQRKIVSDTVKTILDSKAVNEKRKRQEAEESRAKKKREEHDRDCFACYACREL